LLPLIEHAAALMTVRYRFCVTDHGLGHLLEGLPVPCPISGRGLVRRRGPMPDITCTRMVDGTAACSLPRRHRHHSREGFDFGYSGVGPADLALNILAATLPLEPGDDGVRLADTSQVSKAAWDLHEAFTRDVVARLPHEGGVISTQAIRDWVAAQVERKRREVAEARHTLEMNSFGGSAG
jgi:hypothetical protein